MRPRSGAVAVEQLDGLLDRVDDDDRQLGHVLPLPLDAQLVEPQRVKGRSTNAAAESVTWSTGWAPRRAPAGRRRLHRPRPAPARRRPRPPRSTRSGCCTPCGRASARTAACTTSARCIGGDHHPRPTGAVQADRHAVLARHRAQLRDCRTRATGDRQTEPAVGEQRPARGVRRRVDQLHRTGGQPRLLQRRAHSARP